MTLCNADLNADLNARKGDINARNEGSGLDRRAKSSLTRKQEKHIEKLHRACNVMTGRLKVPSRDIFGYRTRMWTAYAERNTANLESLLFDLDAILHPELQ